MRRGYACSGNSLNREANNLIGIPLSGVVTIWVLLLLLASAIQAQDRLDTPTNLSFANDTLTWESVANADRYRLRWRAGNGPFQFATVNHPHTTYDFSALPLNVTYSV